MPVGELMVTPVRDGRFDLPANLFFPETSEADWAPHQAFLDDDGTLPLDVGGFLIRDPPSFSTMSAGRPSTPNAFPANFLS